MVVDIRVADAELVKRGLPPNADMLENSTLNAAEEEELKQKIVAKLPDASVMEHLDETSRVRIFRGMITNNKGTHEERIAEAIESYERIGTWRRDTGPGCLQKQLNGEDIMFHTMQTHVGGLDLYGHLVWAERLGDIGAVVDHPVPVSDATAIRLKTMEMIRVVQTQHAEERGQLRYKQVYIIDLKDIPMGKLMTRGQVREMTTAIMSGANAYAPETLWKLFIVNAPFIFRSVYTIISPFIHEITKQKIKILGGPSKYIPEMEANGIPKSAIPQILGGTHPNVTMPEVLAKLNAQT